MPRSSLEHRLLGIGFACLLTAAALQVWASLALVDAGYFARMSTFLAFMLLAGVAVLISTAAANAWIAVSQIRARERMKERTAAQVISAGRTAALRLAGQETAA